MEGGEHLGLVGGRIVGEVIIGLLHSTAIPMYGLIRAGDRSCRRGAAV
jgi:hypothetical protein